MAEIKVHPKRRLVADINVVPYIDVMLVLLVVFMVTAPMMTQGIAVDLPKTNSQPVNLKDEEPVIISVNAQGQYFINVGDNKQSASSLDTVKGHVARIHRNKPETLFLIEGDEQVAYGKVVTLMAAVQAVGVEKLGMITEPPGK